MELGGSNVIYFTAPCYDTSGADTWIKNGNHIRSLTLAFYGVPVNIPEWLENNEIDKFIIEGTLSDEEEAQLTQRFPKAKIRRMEPPKNGIDIRMFEGLHLAGYSSLNAKDFQ